MSSARCGWLYKPSPSRPGSSDLRGFVVLSEDDWNGVMGDSVVVPIYKEPGATPSELKVEVQKGLFADCSKVISLTHEVLGEAAGKCSQEPWVRIRMGVRMFLDIDARVAKAPKSAVVSTRTAWWPQRDDVHLASHHLMDGRKLFAVISDDDFNSGPTTNRAAFVKLTSKTKEFRERWEVPVSGGWVVSGDVYQLLYADVDPATPDVEKYPAALTPDESSALARNQKKTLTLS